MEKSVAAAGLGPLPAIPAKRYFTIGEVSDLCRVKPYVLRYWEQEFTQLKPMKRRGNRRYYQHHEVLLIRRIRDLLYEQGFTISGARNRLAEGGVLIAKDGAAHNGVDPATADHAANSPTPYERNIDDMTVEALTSDPGLLAPAGRQLALTPEQWRAELMALRRMLGG
jgi:DNA-binding transcriptional MerR regulator